jgi:hypothetical protein
MYALLKTACIVFLISPLNILHAAIIEGNFSGRVLDVLENADVSPYYIDYFSPNLSNSKFSGSFRYDTDLMPANLVPDFAAPNQPHKGGYFAYEEGAQSPWLDIKLKVDGKVLYPNKNPDGTEANNFLNVMNIGSEYAAVREDELESFGMALYSSRVINNDSSIFQSFAISFDSSLQSLIDKNSLEQEFSWVDTAEYTHDYYDPPPGWALYHLGGRNWYSTLWLQITDISLQKYHSSTVPEPSSIGLLVFALLLALFFRRLKISTGIRMLARDFCPH